MGRIFGLDLGTRKCRAAMLVHGAPYAIMNDADGMMSFSTVLSFHEDGGISLGDDEDAAAVFPVILRHKDRMDEDFCINGHNYTLEQLIEILLRLIKRGVEESAGETVKSAVFAVPSFLTPGQRRTIVQAARNVGIETRCVCSAPIAAATAYYSLMDWKEAPGKKFLVYSLEEDTFDVYAFKCTPEGPKALACDGDPRLGSLDWDRQLCDLLAWKFEELGFMEPDEELLWLFRDRAVSVRKRLQHRDQCAVKFLYDGTTYRLDVRRQEFEDATAHLLEASMGRIDTITGYPGCSDAELDNVVLVGEGTKMPQIQQALRQRFGDKVVVLDPELAAAKGAALIGWFVSQM